MSTEIGAIQGAVTEAAEKARFGESGALINMSVYAQYIMDIKSLF